jgi:hypothetical protein
MDWGGLRRTEPISRQFGYDRGTPIDRYYIEQFLGASASAITGRVLEIGDDTYTRRFGGSRVTVRDILHISETNPDATIIGDLSADGTIPADLFDCAIVTQTLHLIFEPCSAVTNLYRGLKIGGTLLATVPGITPVSNDEWRDTWYWAFTMHSVRRIFGDVFGAAAIDVQGFGNVFAALCFLQGIAMEEVTTAELDARDPNYDVLIAVRAQKLV